MLLFQKTFVEGLMFGNAVQLLCGYGSCKEGEEKEKYNLLLELLTPVAKSYPAEMSNLSTSTAIQIFGGYGFTKDFIAEQYYRETRIHTIHEGTTAIHGLDLRKKSDDEEWKSGDVFDAGSDEGYHCRKQNENTKAHA